MQNTICHRCKKSLQNRPLQCANVLFVQCVWRQILSSSTPFYSKSYCLFHMSTGKWEWRSNWFWAKLSISISCLSLCQSSLVGIEQRNWIEITDQQLFLQITLMYMQPLIKLQLPWIGTDLCKTLIQCFTSFAFHSLCWTSHHTHTNIFPCGRLCL